MISNISKLSENLRMQLSEGLIYKYFSNMIKVNSIDKVIEVAKRNKVLYQLGLLFPEVRCHPSWTEISKRKILQQREIVLFDELARKLNIRYIIVKTFKFPEYVPDDIDVLIHAKSRSLLDKLISELIKNHGYFIRSKGTKEFTIRKYDEGTYVDFDIHEDMSAGSYVYISNNYFFKSENLRIIKVHNVEIPAPIEELEYIVCAAHSILKEFELTLGDVLSYVYMYRNNDRIYELSKELGLLRTVNVFSKVSSILISNILNKTGRKIKLPYRVSIFMVSQAYFENLGCQLKRHGITPLVSLLSFPSSRGIKKIFDVL